MISEEGLRCVQNFPRGDLDLVHIDSPSRFTVNRGLATGQSGVRGRPGTLSQTRMLLSFNVKDNFVSDLEEQDVCGTLKDSVHKHRRSETTVLSMIHY